MKITDSDSTRYRRTCPAFLPCPENSPVQPVERLAPSEESWEVIGRSEVGDPGSHGQIILQIPCGVTAGGDSLVQVRLNPVALGRADVLDPFDMLTRKMRRNIEFKTQHPASHHTR